MSTRLSRRLQNRSPMLDIESPNWAPKSANSAIKKTRKVRKTQELIHFDLESSPPAIESTDNIENVNPRRKLRARRHLKPENCVAVTAGPVKAGKLSNEVIITETESISPSLGSELSNLNCPLKVEEKFIPSTSGAVETTNKRRTFELEESVNDISVLKRASEIDTVRISTSIEPDISVIEILDSPSPEVTTSFTRNRFEAMKTPGKTSTPNLRKNLLLKKLDDSKNGSFNLSKSSKIKIPNFAAIHQRALEKMESIEEYKKRKEERARILMTGGTPFKNSFQKQKKIGFAPGTEERTKSPTYIPLPNTPMPKKFYKNDKKDEKSPPKPILKKIQKFLHSPRLLKNKPTIAVNSKIPNPKLFGSLKPKENDLKFAPSKLPIGIFNFSKSNDKLGNCNNINGNNTKVITRREAEIQSVATKSKPINNKSEKQRTMIKGVRSNRRFELLMNMRKELILETDPEKGKGEFAFDNPGFKDPGLTPITKSLEKTKIDSNNKPKWNQWSPLSALTTKSEKRKTLDDTAVDGNTVKVVALRSHDFTGLGFNICGNMKEGIYIKDVLHRGPASESGKLSPGDRINSVTISFEHMVYEDALTILSYASPYEVIIEARGGKIVHTVNGQSAQPSHPVYRSSSCTELFQNGSKSKRKLFGPEDHSGSLSSNYSSLQKSRSNMTTLERKDSESPKNVHNKTKKTPTKTQLTPEQLKIQLEQKILSDHQNNLRNKNEKAAKVEVEVQKTENKMQKFGIRVLPSEKSPVSAELSQNDNNINLEKQPLGIDEVDDKKPVVKRRERKVTPEGSGENFSRDPIINGSGIKRDVNGIPQEIPNYMMNAAVAARSNRKASDDKGKIKDEEVEKTPKKAKGKAPSPPEEKSKINLDEIQAVIDEIDTTPQKANETLEDEEEEVELRSKSEVKDYNSDSDLETDNQSSVNTIELNSSDITIHHPEENRRTASTGDLTKIQKTRKSSTGTLERAQSLDITDTSMPTLTKKRKGGRIEDNIMDSEEDIFRKVMMSKEPRLSLILDGLNTCQRNRLKKSTEWGNLEDAILKLNPEDESNSSSNQNMSLENIKFDFGEKIEEFDALVNKINEIKRESLELENADKKKKNQIWPTFGDSTSNKTNGIAISPIKSDEFSDDNPRLVAAEKRQRKPPMFEMEDPVLPEPVIVEKKEVPEVKSSSSDDISNKSDEIKSKEDVNYLHLMDSTRNFLFTEKITYSHNENEFKYLKSDDTNISDDIKVSRHSLGSLERPKSDDAKMNVSNITVNRNEDEQLHSLEVNINNPSSLKSEDISELYITALDKTVKPESFDTSKVTISTPDIIKNVTIAEAINTLNNDVVIHGPSSLTFEIPGESEHIENTYSVGVKSGGLKEEIETQESSPANQETDGSLSKTYITEIQVLTPHNNKISTNISEIEIPGNRRNLDNEFENYVRNYETNVKNFEANIQKLENSHKNDMKNIIITDNSSVEKELHKIHEIAEEQLKKLPEMRFTTSSYESPKTPEKRQSQIELLRSNFEKSPPKLKNETKSRIPIATSTKTPPTSPERRDSRNLDMENDRDILELMSSTVHSTPVVSKLQKPASKNVTVTSIRSNSKIPSGLPVLSGGSRPPIPPRKQEGDDHGVQISTNGNVESSFKQWVFNPSDHAVNIVVSESKQQK